MTGWWFTLAGDLYGFVAVLFSPDKLHQHIESALTSWPLAIVIIGVSFRKQIAKMIATMRTLSYKDGSREVVANWGEGVQELKEIEQVAEAEKPLPAPAVSEDFEKLMALAKVNRRSAIIEAWLSVESAARELVEPYYEGTKSLSSPVMVERELWRRELIGPNERELLSRLRSLRNEASHMKNFEITEEEAAAYIDTALSLTTRLKNLKETQ
ncbi:hypothetical protein [Rhizobium laguerreae]|uniref:hypothetical protein n=1 Tax=Rhizobium laguerreae TaxID=1076926 RepID=UPI001C920654|nr:hypothetical protein [Rhizobium laguerreae]MBY3137323.1 hypothetical protein [Rhizobium laguerreae]